MPFMLICSLEFCENERHKRFKYCSYSCYNEYRLRRRETRRIPCEQCGELTLNERFCGSTCAAQMNNVIAPKRTAEIIVLPDGRTSRLGERVTIRCEHCDTIFAALTGRNKVYACRVACRNRVKHRNALELWTRGDADRPPIYQAAREYLFSLYGSICWDCGFDKKHPTSGAVPLQVEHVDGNHSNWHIDNLRMLCGACHSLTTTWGNFKRDVA